MLRKASLPDEDKKMYALEKLENFRWIFSILATRSSYLLTESDRVSSDIEVQLADIGQFAELAFIIVPLELLLQNVSLLSEPGFPLDGYFVLKETRLVSTMTGNVGHLPASVLYRSSTRQLVVAISGTSSLELALHDLRVWKCKHPSNRGRTHTGFLDLYRGLKSMLFDAMKKALEAHEIAELVITGHSMGGSISYLLCMDLLSGNVHKTFVLPPKIILAVFGAPRTGDSRLVEFWRELVANYRNLHGPENMIEYSVKAYNDGVPSLPPSSLGYRHFAVEPFYLDRTRLFHTPSSECEHALFNTAPCNKDEGGGVRFVKGGHNYYNGRDFERLRRRLEWLDKSDITRNGWEDRYRELAFKSIG